MTYVRPLPGDLVLSFFSGGCSTRSERAFLPTLCLLITIHVHTCDEAVDDEKKKTARRTHVGTQSQLNLCAFILSYSRNLRLNRACYQKARMVIRSAALYLVLKPRTRYWRNIRLNSARLLANLSYLQRKVSYLLL